MQNSWLKLLCFADLEGFNWGDITSQIWKSGNSSTDKISLWPNADLFVFSYQNKNGWSWNVKKFCSLNNKINSMTLMHTLWDSTSIWPDSVVVFRHPSLLELSRVWLMVSTLALFRVKKLRETLVAVQQLDKNMSSLRSWLSHIETELSRPIVYDTCDKQEVQRKLNQQQASKRCRQILTELQL